VPSNTFTIWTTVVLTATSLAFTTPIVGQAEESEVLAGAVPEGQKNVQKARAQACPGCDADVASGSCGGESSPEASETGFRIPYGAGASRYREVSGINSANRSIGRNMRNLNDSVRRMNDSINRIRNLNRRF
jgi:hypothetical protein